MASQLGWMKNCRECCCFWFMLGSVWERKRTPWGQRTMLSLCRDFNLTRLDAKPWRFTLAPLKEQEHTAHKQNRQTKYWI